METNCKNCAGPLNYHKIKREYCGTFFQKNPSTHYSPYTLAPLLESFDIQKDIYLDRILGYITTSPTPFIKYDNK